MAIEVRRATTIARSPREVYDFWRHIENLPRFMDHLKSVTTTGDKTSHWVAKAPLGQSVEWDAEITQDRPGEIIAWQSLPGAQIENSGEVRFQQAPGDRGTVVHVALQYNPPGGPVGAALAKVFGEEPDQQVREDVRRLKRLLETGEIPTTEGQPSGREQDAAKRDEAVQSPTTPSSSTS